MVEKVVNSNSKYGQHSDIKMILSEIKDMLKEVKKNTFAATGISHGMSNGSGGAGSGGRTFENVDKKNDLVE